jgi:hypothetical protein
LAFVTYSFNGNSSADQTLGARGYFVSDHHSATVDELRSWTRFAKERGTDVALIFHPREDHILADVNDESQSGIGLYLDDVRSFDVGQEVEIFYDNEFFRARVSHVDPFHEGGYLVGFSCARESELEGCR